MPAHMTGVIVGTWRRDVVDKDRYALGYSEEEDCRLAQQGVILETLTEDVFRRAGIEHGMRILDLGCGVGDVSMLAARLVGPEGSILGIDRSGASIETARRRAKHAGYANIEYQVNEIDSFEPQVMFDAIVGRLVLLYQPDPGMAIRRLGQFLRPGGIAAFHEIDLSPRLWASPNTLAEQVGHWIVAAFASVGVPTDIGPMLPSIFVKAGFGRPEMIAGQRVGGGADSPLYDYLAASVRSLLPMIERANIATAAEVHIETLAERIRAEAMAKETLIYTPRMIGAWACKP